MARDARAAASRLVVVTMTEEQQVTDEVLGDKDLLEKCLVPLDGFELRRACVSKAWRDAAKAAPSWRSFVGVDSERKLRFACGLGDATVQLRADGGSHSAVTG